jgi:hypothetical protein
MPFWGDSSPTLSRAAPRFAEALLLLRECRRRGLRVYIEEAGLWLIGPRHELAGRLLDALDEQLPQVLCLLAVANSRSDSAYPKVLGRSRAAREAWAGTTSRSLGAQPQIYQGEKNEGTPPSQLLFSGFSSYSGREVGLRDQPQTPPDLPVEVVGPRVPIIHSQRSLGLECPVNQSDSAQGDVAVYVGSLAAEGPRPRGARIPRWVGPSPPPWRREVGRWPSGLQERWRSRVVALAFAVPSPSLPQIEAAELQAFEECLGGPDLV